MLIPGLVSVTFRPFTRERVVQLVKTAALSCIEWGGDVHVPPSDSAALKDARRLREEQEIAIASYGSYYRCGSSPEAEEEADAVLAAACALGTRHIRVWAGVKGSAEAGETRVETVRSLRKFCQKAATHGITVSPEFHQGTLTDHYESAVRLVEEVAEDNLRLYWQPNQFCDDDYNLSAIRAVLPYLSNVHVFTWDAHSRYPLADGEMQWRRYLDVIRESRSDHAMLMEFVPGDREEDFLRDAETLLSWLR